MHPHLSTLVSVGVGEWKRLFLVGRECKAGSVGEVGCRVCVVGVDCKVTLSVLSLNGLFLLQGAQIALNVRVSVFYSPVHHGKRSQVSVRCQVATCLCVFKAAVAWIVFTAQRAQHRGVVGGVGEERGGSTDFDLMQTV